MIVMFFFFKQKTAYEMRISDWSSDVCSSDLPVSLCFRIAQNVAIDFARAHNRAPSTTQEDEVEQHAADDPGPEHCAAAMQELELAKRVIGRLPPGCRHVFLLSRSHGLSNLEIAARCGVSSREEGSVGKGCVGT